MDSRSDNDEYDSGHRTPQQIIAQFNLEDAFQQWANKRGINYDNLSYKGITDYLKANFQLLPIDLEFISEFSGMFSLYFQENPRSTFHHVAIIGGRHLGIDHLSLVLKTLIYPIAQSHHFSISIYAEKNFVPYHAKKWKKLIEEGDEMIIIKECGLDDEASEIITEIAKFMKRGILITFWGDDDWAFCREDILKTDDHLLEVKLKPITYEQSVELLNLIKMYIHWDYPIDDIVYKFFYDHSRGYPEKLVRMFLNAIKETFVTKKHTLDYNAAVLAMLDEDD